MKEREPEPWSEISLEELKLMVGDTIGMLQGQIEYLEGLVAKAEFGYDHNFRVRIMTDGEQVSVELETKPPIGFRTP